MNHTEQDPALKKIKIYYKIERKFKGILTGYYHIIIITQFKF